MTLPCVKYFEFSFPALRNEELSNKNANLCVFLINWKTQQYRKCPPPWQCLARAKLGLPLYEACAPQRAWISPGQLHHYPPASSLVDICRHDSRCREKQVEPGTSSACVMGQVNQSSSALTTGLCNQHSELVMSHNKRGQVNRLYY